MLDLPPVESIKRDEIPQALSELEIFKAQLWMRFITVTEEDRLLTPKEVSRRLGCSPTQVLRMIRSSELPGCQRGKRLAVRKLVLERWLRQK